MFLVWRDPSVSKLLLSWENFKLRCSAPPHSRSSSHCRRRLYSTVLSVYVSTERNHFPKTYFPLQESKSQQHESQHQSLHSTAHRNSCRKYETDTWTQDDCDPKCWRRAASVFLCGAVDHTTEIQCFGGYFLHLSCMSKQHTFAAKTLRCLHHQRALVSANRLGKASYWLQNSGSKMSTIRPAASSLVNFNDTLLTISMIRLFCHVHVLPKRHHGFGHVVNDCLHF